MTQQCWLLDGGRLVSLVLLVILRTGMRLADKSATSEDAGQAKQWQSERYGRSRQARYFLSMHPCYHVSAEVITMPLDFIAAQGSATNWVLVGPLIGAVVAAVGLIVAERHRKRETVQTVVDRAVDARIGQVFREFSEYEASARNALESAQSVERQLEQRLGASESLTHRLDELLGSGDQVVTTLEKSKAMIPALLLEHAKNSDVPTALGYLSSLANSPIAASDEFERGGDAAFKCRSYELAMKLYERALEVTPQNATARASLIRVRARLGKTSLEDSVQEISNLALAHPNNRTVLMEACNTCMDFKDYRSLKDLCEGILKVSPKSVTAWRNLAIALDDLGFPENKVKAAFENALQYVRVGFDESSDIAHTAKVYVNFLKDHKDFEKAREIIRRGLEADPGLEILLILQGDLEVVSGGDVGLALWCYKEVATGGDSSTSAIAITKIEELAKRANLEKVGIVPPTVTASIDSHQEPSVSTGPSSPFAAGHASDGSD
ncbi:tetratricopeptide repeat protein [Streptomyces sp. NPDC005925]|uniref:tetratricopeptide repeat protein n=1 Tax=Streptomyces sp. NPDC005925 TaxID=3157172 RepID=UPI0033F37E65